MKYELAKRIEYIEFLKRYINLVCDRIQETDPKIRKICEDEGVDLKDCVTLKLTHNGNQHDKQEISWIQTISRQYLFDDNILSTLRLLLRNIYQTLDDPQSLSGQS